VKSTVNLESLCGVITVSFDGVFTTKMMSGSVVTLFESRFSFFSVQTVWTNISVANSQRVRVLLNSSLVSHLNVGSNDAEDRFSSITFVSDILEVQNNATFITQTSLFDTTVVIIQNLAGVSSSSSNRVLASDVLFVNTTNGSF
jgi:hypothetical protein